MPPRMPLTAPPGGGGATDRATASRSGVPASTRAAVIEARSASRTSSGVVEYTPPDGVMQVGGEWYYTENAQGGGVRSLGLDEGPPRTGEEERKGILDLFRSEDSGASAPQ